MRTSNLSAQREYDRLHTVIKKHERAYPRVSLGEIYTRKDLSNESFYSWKKAREAMYKIHGILRLLVVVLAMSACSAVDMQAVVTGYYGGDFSGITSTGVDTDQVPRGVAVAPSVIPYGSVVLVPGYGAAVADDTGGALRKDARKGIVHIDLRFPSHKQAMAWGVRRLTITVEKPE